MDNVVNLNEMEGGVADDLTRLFEQVKAALYPEEVCHHLNNFEKESMSLDDLVVYVRSLETLEKSTRELMRGRARNGEDVRLALEGVQQLKNDHLEKRRKDS